MIRTEIKHIIGNVHANNALESKVIKTIKTVKFLGVVIYRKVLNYPDPEIYQDVYINL